jgi:DNA primase
VSPTKQFYHCFGCGAHGSAIGFLMEYADCLSSRPSRSWPARSACKVPEDSKGATPTANQPSNEGPLPRHGQAAAQFYREQLKNAPRQSPTSRSAASPARSPPRFGIGYAPDDWQGLKTVFPDYDRPALVECGLVIENDTGPAL